MTLQEIEEAFAAAGVFSARIIYCGWQADKTPAGKWTFEVEYEEPEQHRTCTAIGIGHTLPMALANVIRATQWKKEIAP